MTRVLIAHSRYKSGNVSGENRVVADEVRLLRNAGHQVEELSRDASEVAVMNGLSGMWSPLAYAASRKAARCEMVDVLHAHNVFTGLSPAILRAGLPTVMTLHNFRLACLPANLLRNDRICEDCLGRIPWRGVLHGCYHGSRVQSAVIATSLALHRGFRTFDQVTLYAAVSKFVAERLIEGGLPRDKVIVRHNFSWPTEPRVGPGSFFLSLGRLSSEKGLDSVVQSWRSRARLVVVGDGPQRGRLEALAAPGVEFHGAVDAAEVPELLRHARALLVPSVWYEGSPRTIVEAFAAGVPVIVSRIGGLPEHVDHGASGLLVDPGDQEAWNVAIEQLEDDDESERLGVGAYAAWHARFRPDLGLRSLEAIYTEAIRRAHAA